MQPAFFINHGGGPCFLLPPEPMRTMWKPLEEYLSGFAAALSEPAVAMLVVSGHDHGVFIPLKVAFPHADVPVVPLSMQRGLDPAAHMAIGHALKPLREQGVLIIGSGRTYHNMRGFG
jgi:hypothetical protein